MVILEAYADLPMPDGSGSMSLKGWEAGGYVYNFLGTITYPPQNAGTFENDDDLPNFPFGGVWTRSLKSSSCGCRYWICNVDNIYHINDMILGDTLLLMQLWALGVTSCDIDLYKPAYKISGSCILHFTTGKLR